MCRSVYQNSVKSDRKFWKCGQEIHLRPWVKYGLQRVHVHWTHDQSLNFVDLCVEFVTHRTKSVENTSNILLPPIKYGIAFTTPRITKPTFAEWNYAVSCYMNVTQIGEEVWKVRVEIHLLRSVNCDCNWTDLHDIHASSTTFCKELSYGISWKSHLRFLQWYYVTDGQTNIFSTSVFRFLHKEHLNVIYNWQWFLHHKLRRAAQ